MQNRVYLPMLSAGRLVKAFCFEAPNAGTHYAALLTDCRSAMGPQYAHVLVVHRGGLDSPPVMAVASEVNRMAGPGSGRSHFLGLFPGAGGPSHVNLGASDDWAEMAKFEPRALAVLVEHLRLASPPHEIPVTDAMRRAYVLPRPLA